MLERRVLDFFSETCPVRPGDTLLLAVSGGPDSVALFHLLLAVRDTLGIDLETAHLNHGIRGPEAEGDAQFVALLAARHGLALHQRRVDVPGIAAARGESLEAAARRERYAFLEEARKVAGARWTVTGHTADDQVETFLMNLLRGAGPRGLGGMLPAGPGPLCRPLLGTWRREIQEYLDRRALEFRIDSSNADVSLTRNRIRHHVVPHLIAEMGPLVPRILARESRLMNEIETYLGLAAEDALRRLVPGAAAGPGEVRIPVEEFAHLHPALRRSVLRSAFQGLAGNLEELTLGHTDLVLDLLSGGAGSAEVHLPRGITARREYGTLVLSALGPEPALEPSAPLDLGRPGDVRWGPLRLRWRIVPRSESDPGSWAAGPDRACLDPERLVEPIYVRAVRPGDRIEPFGMEGGSKLSDILIDRKVPRRQRTRVALLCDNGGSEAGERILWVVGQRRARFAPVGRETSQVLLVEAETIL